MKYLAFDIEIARNFDQIRFDEFEPEDDEKIEILLGEDWVQDIYKDHNLVLCSPETVPSVLFWRPIDNKDWKRFRPLGITCAAAASSDGELWNWYAHDGDRRFADRMSQFQCIQLIEILYRMTEKNYKLLTWNGLSFDFNILLEESDLQETCKDLALNHVDMMFHFFCSKGFPLGLDTAAKGMGFPGKPEGMDGAKAPKLWAEGQYHKVLDYVSWDVKNTLEVAQAVDAAGRLDWTSKVGRPNSWSCSRWLTVKEAMALPLPDTSWMDTPWPRKQFYEWTGYEPPRPEPEKAFRGNVEDWQLFDLDEDEC